MCVEGGGQGGQRQEGREAGPHQAALGGPELHGDACEQRSGRPRGPAPSLEPRGGGGNAASSLGNCWDCFSPTRVPSLWLTPASHSLPAPAPLPTSRLQPGLASAPPLSSQSPSLLTPPPPSPASRPKQPETGMAGPRAFGRATCASPAPASFQADLTMAPFTRERSWLPWSPRGDVPAPGAGRRRSETQEGVAEAERGQGAQSLLPPPPCDSEVTDTQPIPQRSDSLGPGCGGTNKCGSRWREGVSHGVLGEGRLGPQPTLWLASPGP